MANNPECPIFKCTGDFCYLRDMVTNQAKTGDYKAKDKKEGGGPFWDRKDWDDLMVRIRQMAPSCLHTDEVLKLTETITKEKEEKSEFI